MSKSVLFLHIGTPKTGTSAIQLFLAENRSVLEKRGWTYPDFGFTYPDASELRNALWLAREMEPMDDERREKGMPALLELSDRFPHMILSEESLWTQGGYCAEGRDRFWKYFASFLESHEIGLKVIVYLRRQDQFLYSYWAQKVKKRDETRPFAQFVKEYGLERTRLDYCRYLDLIADGIGAENLIVRPYERSHFEKGSIVYDFLSVVGLKVDDSFVFPKESNSSMSDCVLEAKRFMNRALYQDRSVGYMYNYLWNVQRKYEKEGKIKNRNPFSASERKEFLKAYEKTNADTARKYVYPDLEPEKVPQLFDQSDLEREYEPWVFSREEIADVYNCLFLMVNARNEEKTENLQNRVEKLQDRNRMLKEKVMLERWRQNPVNRMKEKMGKTPQIKKEGT